MLVSNLLEQKGDGVATVPSTASVATVVAELARHGVGALVVSSDGETIDGIVSERDIVRRLSELRMALLSEPVSSIISTAVRTCTPEDDVATIMSLMTDQRI
ncbi:MAG TPA: CBS domain-containing protein, partial [Acidimicrobiales bacterium]|nr:CBS domain-containing protein [Acidimicrobiales bacterium]